MANTASARKRIRQNERRRERNVSRMSRVRTFVKKVETAILSGDKSAANDALRAAQPEMQRAVGKGVLAANTVSRKLSRLSARIKLWLRPERTNRRLPYEGLSGLGLLKERVWLDEPCPFFFRRLPQKKSSGRISLPLLISSPYPVCPLIEGQEVGRLAVVRAPIVSLSCNSGE